MRILVFLCYAGYSLRGNLGSPVSKKILQDVLEEITLRFCPSRRPNILISTFTDCNVKSLSNAATIDFELPGKQKLGSEQFDINWFRFNFNRLLISNRQKMRLIDAKFVHESFDPQLIVAERSYIYRFIIGKQSSIIEKSIATQLKNEISFPLLRSAIEFIDNRPLNYLNFTSESARNLINDPNRTVRVRVEKIPQLFSNIEIERKSTSSFLLELNSTNFLHQMARRLSNDLVAVGQGLLSIEQFQNKFSHFEIRHDESQHELIDTNGLYLQNVRYDQSDFQRYATFTSTQPSNKKIQARATVFTGEE